MNYFAKIILRNDFQKKDGTSPICLRLTLNRKIKLISVQKSVLPQFWNQETSLVKKTYPDSENINLLIRSYIKRANDIILNYVVHNKPLSFDDFEREFRHQKTDSFYTFIENELAKSRLTKEYASESLRTYTTELSKLRKFRKHLTINDVNISFLESYEIYMIQELNNKINTVHKSLKTIRTFINKAIRQNLLRENVFHKYRLKTETASRQYLTEEELTLLETYYSNSMDFTYKNTAKVFLFACYTGLRYNDLKYLKYSNIEDNCIRIKMHKTGEDIAIPLINRAKALIDANGLRDQFVFRVFSNQVMNRYLKEIMKQTKIFKSVSFHCARHTFATQSLTLGIRMEVVSRLLGHKDIKVTQIYAKVVDNLKFEEMMKWNKVMT